jgi:hypothetical protein
MRVNKDQMHTSNPHGKEGSPLLAGGGGWVVNPVLTFHEFRFTITGAAPLKSFVLPCVDSGSA